MSAQQGRRTDRAAYRAFVRENHPDVGGDPEAFVAGIAEFERAERRFDAPIVVVERPGGLRGVPYRVRSWWRRRGAPPRVQ